MTRAVMEKKKSHPNTPPSFRKTRPSTVPVIKPNGVLQQPLRMMLTCDTPLALHAQDLKFEQTGRQSLQLQQVERPRAELITLAGLITKKQKTTKKPPAFFNIRFVRSRKMTL